MSESDAIIEVPEAAAVGTTAKLYRDIRETQGLPLVNLIWRHLATRAGALKWAWSIARPLYAQGIAQAGAVALAASLDLPRLPLISTVVTAGVGLNDADRESIRAIIAAYNRGNGLNLIALSALLADTDQPARVNSRRDLDKGAVAGLTQTATSAATGQPSTAQTPRSELPPILLLDALPKATHALVVALNRFGAGDDSESPIVATLYRHLGHWPGFLALAWTHLAPLQQSGEFARIVNDVRNHADQHAGRAAAKRGAASAAIEPSDIDFARAAIAQFRDTAIARMFPIGLLLSRALAPADNPARMPEGTT